MKQFYTYLHCKPDGTPFYVGKGIGNRAQRLIGARRSRYHKNICEKYGVENIGIFIFPCESEQQALDDEIQQIDQLRSGGYELCNLTDGGDNGAKGYKHTKEYKENLSKRMIGKKYALGNKMKITHIAKLTAIHKGKKLSEEHRAKLSIAKKGKSFTNQHRENLSKSHIGNKNSAETRAKLSITTKAVWEKRRVENV